MRRGRGELVMGGGTVVRRAWGKQGNRAKVQNKGGPEQSTFLKR